MQCKGDVVCHLSRRNSWGVGVANLQRTAVECAGEKRSTAAVSAPRVRIVLHDGQQKRQEQRGLTLWFPQGSESVVMGILRGAYTGRTWGRTLSVAVRDAREEEAHAEMERLVWLAMVAVSAGCYVNLYLDYHDALGGVRVIFVKLEHLRRRLWCDTTQCEFKVPQAHLFSVFNVLFHS